MPTRVVCVAILIYWAVAATALVTRDLLPELSVGSPPDFRSVTGASDPDVPVLWDVQVIDNPGAPENRRSVGQATTASRRLEGGWVELSSEVWFDSGRLLKGTPFASKTDERIEFRSTFRVDPTGKLRSFHAGVRSQFEPDELLKIDGVLNGQVMEVVSRGPLPIMNRTLRFDYPDRGLVQSRVGPPDRLPGLQVGQRWDERVANPLTGQVELVRAEVKGKAFLHWDNNPVSTLEVVSKSQTLSARTWVRPDGLVLRQEVPFPLLRLVLERRPAHAPGGAGTPPAEATGR